MPNTNTPILNQSKKKDKHKFIQNLFQNLKIKKHFKKILFLVYPNKVTLPDSGMINHVTHTTLNGLYGLITLLLHVLFGNELPVGH
jgi:hypothetical protein